MLGDTVHTLEEFSQFPWDKLNDEWFKTCGGYGYGGVVAGVNFNPAKPHISFVRDDGTADVWAIPDQLRRLIDRSRQHGAEESYQRNRPSLDMHDLDVLNGRINDIRSMLEPFDGPHVCSPGCDIESPSCGEMTLRRLLRDLKSVVEPQPSTYRPDRLRNWPERVMFEEWCKECQSNPGINDGWGALEHILGEGRPRPITRPEHLVAGTVIQWLGTNCGAAFLDRCARRISSEKEFRRVGGMIRPWRQHAEEVPDAIDSFVTNVVDEYWPQVAMRHESASSSYAPGKLVDSAPSCKAEARKTMQGVLRTLVGIILWLKGDRDLAVQVMKVDRKNASYVVDGEIDRIRRAYSKKPVQES